MAIGFIAKAVEAFRKLFGRKKVKHSTSSISRRNTSPPPPIAPEVYLQERRFLLRNGEPVGRTRNRRHPTIRCLPVRNFAEAYRFFIRLCDQRRVVLRQAGGYLHYELILDEETVVLDLTDKTKGKPPGTIAVLKVHAIISDGAITEIEFIKLKR